jgi:hypothetical protein
MANLYKTIGVKRNKLSKITYFTNAFYPEIEPTSEDLYIITSWEDRLDLLAYDYYRDVTSGLALLITHHNVSSL